MSKVSGFIEKYNKESWKIDHVQAMEACDFDDWLAMANAFWKLIQERENQYYAAVRSGKAKFDKQCVEEFQRLYEIWYAPSAHLLNQLEAFENDGYEIRNGEAFKAVLSSNTSDFDPTRLQLALERARKGPRYSSKDLRDEVERRIRAGCEGSAAQAS